MLRSAFVLVLASLLVGCPGKGTAEQGPSEVCRKFGDSCRFAPGKLGTCVERPTCAPGENCFVCQSQH